MDALRYGIALVLSCLISPLLLYWPLLHGAIPFWRRLGPAWTWAILGSGSVVCAAALLHLREPLLRIEFGTRWPLVAGGAVLLGCAVWLRILLHRDIDNALLSGLPELAPGETKQPLVRSGLYAHVRHPRYAQLLVVLAGFALVSNHLALYVLTALWVPAMYVITLFEERELRQRFPEYETYRRDVPRFVPARRRRAS